MAEELYDTNNVDSEQQVEQQTPPIKYLYNNKVYKHSDIELAAKENNLDVDTYVKKAGFKTLADNYNYNGKKVSAEDVLTAANENKMDFDTYVTKAKLAPEEDEKKKDGGKSSGTGAFPSTSELFGNKGETTPRLDGLPVTEQNPIDLAQQVQDGRDKKIEGGANAEIGGDYLQPDDAAVSAANKQAADYKAKTGIDLDEIAKETKGLTQNDYGQEGFSKSQLMQDRVENPQFYKRKLGRLKWQNPLELNLANKLTNGDISKEEYDNVNTIIDSSLKNSNTGDYAQQRENINSVANIIKNYGGENKDELLNNYATEVAKIYGSATEHNFKPGTTPESKYLPTSDAQLGYQYLKDISPEKATQYDRLFGDTKNLSPDAKKGADHLMQTLEETGIGLQQNSVNEELNNLKKIAQKNGGLTPEQSAQSEKLILKQEELTAKTNELDNRYPDRLNNKVDDAVQEILGQRLGWMNYAGGMAGKAFKNTGEGIWEAVSEPFMSDESNRMRELSLIGESQVDNEIYHKTDRNKNMLSDALVIKPELQKQIDVIKNNKDLNINEKQQKLESLLRENKESFGRVPMQGSQFNINPSSILYGITDLGTTLLPFMAIEAATGGIGGAGVAAKFLRTFTAAATTGFHDEYANAVMEGKPQSQAYKQALGITAINSMMMAGAGTPEAIKAMAGLKTTAGKILAQYSDEAIQKVIDKGGSKILNSLKERAAQLPKQIGEGIKTGATFEGYMAVGNELKHQVYNTPIDREEGFKHSVLNIMNFGLMGVGLGQAGLKSASDLQKSGLVTIGEKPLDFIAAAEKMKKDGTLSPQEFEQRKSIIEKSAEAYKNLPVSKDNGKPLNEKDKAEYLYNTVIKNNAKESSSTLPPKQAEAAIKESKVADYRNSILLEDYTDKQREDRKTALDKILNPKDIDGKKQEVPDNIRLETEAELQALNEATPKEKDPIKLVEPFVGKGLLIGQDAEQSLKTIAEQSQNISNDGKDVSTTGDAEKSMRTEYGDELVDAAIKKYPKEVLLKNEQPIGETNINSQLKTTDNGKNSKADAEANGQAEEVKLGDNTAPNEKGAVPLPIKEGGVNADVVGSGVGGDVKSDELVIKKYADKEIKRQLDEQGFETKNKTAKELRDLYKKEVGTDEYKEPPRNNYKLKVVSKKQVGGTDFRLGANSSDRSIRNNTEKYGEPFFDEKTNEYVWKTNTHTLWEMEDTETGKKYSIFGNKEFPFSDVEQGQAPDYGYIEKPKFNNGDIYEVSANPEINEKYGNTTLKSVKNKIAQKSVEQSLPTQEVKSEVPSNTEEIKTLEQERDNEIEKVTKPDLKLNLVPSRELIKTKDPVGNKEIQKNIIDKYKKLKLLIECL